METIAERRRKPHQCEVCLVWSRGSEEVHSTTCTKPIPCPSCERLRTILNMWEKSSAEAGTVLIQSDRYNALLKAEAELAALKGGA